MHFAPPNQHRSRTHFHPLVETGLEAWYDVSAVENSGNYIKRSEEINDTAWTKTRVAAFGTVDTGLIGSGSFANTARTLDPIGSNTADFIQEDATVTNTHFFSIPVSMVNPSGSNRIVLYAKDSGRSKFEFYLNNGAVYSGLAVDLTAVTVGDFAGGGGVVTSKSIISVGNGWYRIDFVGSCPLANLFIVALRNAAGTSVYTGNNTDGLFLWGLSIQDASWDSRYIPTGANPIFPNAQADSANSVVNLRNLAPCYCQRGNLLVQSEDFSTTWTRTRINAFGAVDVKAAGSGSFANTSRTLDPLAGNTSDFVQEDATAANTHQVSNGSVTLASGSYSFSVFAKADVRNWLRLSLVLTDHIGAYFDLQNGAVGSLVTGGGASGVASSIQSVGNGWYKCTVSGNLSASGTYNVIFYLSNGNGSVSYNGDNTSGLFLWGAQLRLASWSDQYIKTTTDTVTPQRNGSFRDLYQGTGSAQPLLTRTDNKGNLLLQSEAFSATWSLSGVAAFGALDTGLILAGSFVNTTRTLDPNGGNTADFIQEDGSVAANHIILQSSAISLSGGGFRFSCYIKPSGRQWVFLRVYGGVDGFGVYFNVVNGLVGAQSVTGAGTLSSSSIISVGNGWFRCVVSGSVTVSAAYGSYVYIAEANGDSIFTGNNTDGLFLWGASLSRIEWEDAYIQTTTSIQHAGINQKPTLLFNGTTQYLKTPTFTLQQPATVYIVFRPVSITANDRFFEGVTAPTMGSYQSGSNRFAIVSNTDVAPTDAYPIHATRPEVAAYVFNGAQSSIDADRPYNVAIGLLDAMGFTLGARPTAPTTFDSFSNIQFCECLIFSGAHDINARNRIRRYLIEKWGPKAT